MVELRSPQAGVLNALRPSYQGVSEQLSRLASLGGEIGSTYTQEALKGKAVRDAAKAKEQGLLTTEADVARFIADKSKRVSVFHPEYRQVYNDQLLNSTVAQIELDLNRKLSKVETENYNNSAGFTAAAGDVRDAYTSEMLKHPSEQVRFQGQALYDRLNGDIARRQMQVLSREEVSIENRRQAAAVKELETRLVEARNSVRDVVLLNVNDPKLMMLQSTGLVNKFQALADRKTAQWATNWSLSNPGQSLRPEDADAVSRKYQEDMAHEWLQTVKTAAIEAATLRHDPSVAWAVIQGVNWLRTPDGQKYIQSPDGKRNAFYDVFQDNQVVTDMLGLIAGDASVTKACTEPSLALDNARGDLSKARSAYSNMGEIGMADIDKCAEIQRVAADGDPDKIAKAINRHQLNSTQYLLQELKYNAGGTIMLRDYKYRQAANGELSADEVYSDFVVYTTDGPVGLYQIVQDAGLQGNLRQDAIGSVYLEVDKAAIDAITQYVEALPVGRSEHGAELRKMTSHLQEVVKDPNKLVAWQAGAATQRDVSELVRRQTAETRNAMPDASPLELAAHATTTTMQNIVRGTAERQAVLSGKATYVAERGKVAVQYKTAERTIAVDTVPPAVVDYVKSLTTALTTGDSEQLDTFSAHFIGAGVGLVDALGPSSTFALQREFGSDSVPLLSAVRFADVNNAATRAVTQAYFLGKRGYGDAASAQLKEAYKNAADWARRIEPDNTIKQFASVLGISPNSDAMKQFVMYSVLGTVENPEEFEYDASDGKILIDGKAPDKLFKARFETAIKDSAVEYKTPSGVAYVPKGSDESQVDKLVLMSGTLQNDFWAGNDALWRNMSAANSGRTAASGNKIDFGKLSWVPVGKGLYELHTVRGALTWANDLPETATYTVPNSGDKKLPRAAFIEPVKGASIVVDFGLMGQ